jgi:kynurenine formamidase
MYYFVPFSIIKQQGLSLSKVCKTDLNYFLRRTLNYVIELVFFLKLNGCAGPALMVDVPRDKNITADVMASLHIPKGVRRVLFRTLNTDRKLMWKKEFDTSYVGFMKDGAQWLVDNTDIKLVGVDYLSVGAFDECIPAHLVFLEKREVILVEALNLEHVTPGIYALHCLPLRLRGAEGSPARCILIK